MAILSRMCGFSHSNQMAKTTPFSMNFMLFWQTQGAQLRQCVSVRLGCRSEFRDRKIAFQKLVYSTLAGGGGRGRVFFCFRHSFRVFDFLIPKRPFRCLAGRNRQNAFVFFLFTHQRWRWLMWVEAPGRLRRRHTATQIMYGGIRHVTALQCGKHFRCYRRRHRISVASRLRRFDCIWYFIFIFSN